MSQDSGGAYGGSQDRDEHGNPPDPYQQPTAPSSDPYQAGTQPMPSQYQQDSTPPYQQHSQPPYTPGGEAGSYPSPPYDSGQFQSSPYQSSPYQSSPYGGGPYGPPPSAGTDGFSIAALVTGILGMAIVPIVLGIIGLNRIKRTGQQGKGLAIAGIVLGVIAVVGWTLIVILFAAVAPAVMDEIRNDPRFNDSVQEYGDNPTLDALYDACGAGDDESCDELFLESPSGSEYEEFASTCGGREVVCLPF